MYAHSMQEIRENNATRDATIAPAIIKTDFIRKRIITYHHCRTRQSVQLCPSENPIPKSDSLG